MANRDHNNLTAAISETSTTIEHYPAIIPRDMTSSMKHPLQNQANPSGSAWKSLLSTTTLSPKTDELSFAKDNCEVEPNKNIDSSTAMNALSVKRPGAASDGVPYLSSSPSLAATSPFTSFSVLWGKPGAQETESTVEPGGLHSFSAPFRNSRADSINSTTSLASSNSGIDEWETPAFRRASTASLNNGSSSWKCVGNALPSSQPEISTVIPAPEIQRRPRATSIVIDRPSYNSTSASRGSVFVPLDAIAIMSSANILEETASALNSPTDSLAASRPSSVLSNGSQFVMQLPALLNEEIGIDNAEEAAEIFKRSSMDSLLDFDSNNLFGCIGNGKGHLDGSMHDLRRRSVSWLDNNGNSKEYCINPATAALFSSSSSSHANSSNGSSPVLSSSIDTFPEDFIFAPSTSGTVTQFSKKRFTRRHSIAVDAAGSTSAHVSSSGSSFNNLEDAFVQSLSLSGEAALSTASFSTSGVNANAAEFIPSASSLTSLAGIDVPFNGNIYAAYSGLFKDDLNPTENESSATSLGAAVPSTFLSAMMKSATVSASSASLSSQVSVGSMSNVPFLPSFGFGANLSLSPAQAGIPPTILSYPNASFNLATHKGPLFLTEFKAGRTEIFYVVDIDSSVQVKVGDLVIVEADRGEDLGRITGEVSISKIRQLVAQYPAVDSIGNSPTNSSTGSYHFNSTHSVHSSHHFSGQDDHGNSSANVNHNLAGLKESEIAALLASKEISPKRVHRKASVLDVKFLQAKAQEEALAMVRCQARIRQKKLPMSVVDAEYQWDRNKLTFYFAADRRIDFRELVRDLFRIYKTRIWMCAVDKNRSALLNSLSVAG